MTPRPGGEADKLGNRYELEWAIYHALSCVLDNQRALTLEDPNAEVGQGTEFTYETSGVIEVHQLKRQNGNRNSWTIRALAELKIFETARHHVANGRYYHFVSLIPCRPLQELSDRARKSADLASFSSQWLTKELSPVFNQLSAPEIMGHPQAAWDMLRGTKFLVHDEDEIIRTNEMLAECALRGADGRLISLAIGDILTNNLGKRLTQTDLLENLAERGITPRTREAYQAVENKVSQITHSWRKSVQRGLLQPTIQRAEAIEVNQALDSDKIVLIAGIAGGGKSSVLEQTVALLESTGAKVLALRLDRFDHFVSTDDLGRQLGLETSPAVALTMAAENHPAYLVIDQLDAVSLASGRIPDSFDVVMDLLDEALCMNNIRVVLACRQFDIDNDHRIRSLVSRSDVTTVEVGALETEEVEAAVASMGLDPTHLTPSQCDLLKTPLHLVLLQTISSQTDALAFNSRGSLFKAFWTYKRKAARLRRQEVRFNDVVSRIANAVSNRQTLSVPIEILDDGDLIEDANILVSEYLLTLDSGRIAFFHEAFFDYAFARLWISREESLVDFLLRDEQALFRRAQVRQILQYLYGQDPDRFRSETEAVLTADNIRFHIKETVLAIVGSLVAPTQADAELMLRIAATHPSFEARLWQELRRPQWFARFYEDGQMTVWLDGPDDVMRNHALFTMAKAVEEYPESIVQLLLGYRSIPEYFDWLRWISRFADIWQNRPLFDLVLEAVRQGAYDSAEHELWLTMHDLAKHKPLWAIEFLQAWLIDHNNALMLNEEGKVAALSIREYQATELIKNAAAAEPEAFVQKIVPYLRQVIAATVLEESNSKSIYDWRFRIRLEVDDRESDELDQALFAATVRSLEELAKTAPHTIQSLLEDLAADPYYASQLLLYRALTAGAEYFASWAARLLLEGGRRLDCGYVSDNKWVARELVRAIAPYITDETHQQLEDLFRDLRNEHENHRRWGHSAFMFLSALEKSRLTPVGERRLKEYQRKFKKDAPATPRSITGGSLGSPITSDAVQKMTDEQWLRAMTKHDSTKTNWSTSTGGAHELSRLLQDQVVADPVRFARLTLQLTSEINSEYTNSLLMGFGDADVSDSAGPLIFKAVHHIASLGQTDNDRFLGTALEKYFCEAPLDVVELILDRTLHALDPANDSPVNIWNDHDPQKAADLLMNGMTTARGHLAKTLGDLLNTDADGQRTALVAPHLHVMANDPALSVRSCVAYTLTAALRYARPEALTAFSTLIEADDRLLATKLVVQLMLHIGSVNPEIIDPIIQRLLASEDTEARETGGRIAAFASLEWERPELMQQALAGDLHVRKGVAQINVRHVDRTSNTALATNTLIHLMNDEADEVREEVAVVASRLRGRSLQPFAQLLAELIDSPTYDHAIPQLLITLESAPNRVDELVLKASQRFVDVFGSNVADFRTGAAGDAYYISRLVVRGLAQCQNQTHRVALLDVVDRLLELGSYGITSALEEAERR